MPKPRTFSKVVQAISALIEPIGPALVLQDYEARYSNRRIMPEKQAARLAKYAICPLGEQLVFNLDTDKKIIEALVDVCKQTNGSGVAVVSTAKAAMRAASAEVNKFNAIENTLKSISHIAHFTKSADVAAACAETASLYDGGDVALVADALFNVILPFNYKEDLAKIKGIPMRAAAFLRDKEVMNIVKNSPFLLEIASYTCSKQALWSCIELGAAFLPLPGIPPYIQLGIAKVARATRSGDEVVRWTGLMKKHVAKGNVNPKLMILLLYQFGTQAGDAIPNNIYDRGISGAAESGKNLLRENHETFFREFADCVL
jgi:hypothetical protein